MPRRRGRGPNRFHPQVAPSPLKTRLELFTYALSRLPPRQLPLLAGYAQCIIYAAEKGWIDDKALGKAGASVVGVLSMVTGLLLSYRFSSAIGKWDEGKQVWAAVRVTIQDGMRMVSIPSRPTPTAAPVVSTEDAESCPIQVDGIEASKSPSKGKKAHGSEQDRSRSQDAVSRKVDELAGLLVGFAFALQRRHHLHGSRPLPQPPLCDLLPSGYLSSLKRTEARVRFAESHAGPSGSSSSLTSGMPDGQPSDLSSSHDGKDDPRPGLRRRGTGPPTQDELNSATEDEWELGNLRNKAEEAVSKLAEAVASAGLSDEGADVELRQQLSQLNVQNDSHQGLEIGDEGMVYRTLKEKPKSNLHNPYPPNLPLALLRLMEAYVVGLAEVDTNRGGWAEAKRERGLGVVKALSGHLGEAERLSSNPPPLPLTLHLSHLLLIYLAALPCSLLCVVNGWALVVITVIAGWCLLGLEALVGEVGGVFGSSETHHPLPMFTQQILTESLDISPSFLKYYRTRLVARIGEEEDEVRELDRRRRREEEWLPSFA